MIKLEEIQDERVEQVGPKASKFTYVDISSIDPESKRVVDPKQLLTSKAPSRAKQILKKGDVIISMTRPNRNAVALVPSELDGAIASTGFHVIRTKTILPEFLYYGVQTNKFVGSLCEKVQGALYPAVRPRDINEFEMWVPESFDEQRAIVAEIEKQLTRLDAGVASLKRLQANLKRYRASVLKAACEGKLVPTEAELARKEGRSFESGAELLQRILKERKEKWAGRGKYKEPEGPDVGNLPKLPGGWVWATVEQLSVHVQYGSSAKTNEDSRGVPVLRMGNIEDGNLTFDSLKYLPRKHNEFPDLLLQEGDILFNRTNSAELVGKTAVYKGQPEVCSFASYLIRVRLANGYLPDLLSHHINSIFGRTWIAKVVNQQVGQANVNGSKLQALAVPLPPKAEQERIVAEVDRRLSLAVQGVKAAESNMRRAGSLRQAVLQFHLMRP